MFSTPPDCELTVGPYSLAPKGETLADFEETLAMPWVARKLQEAGENIDVFIRVKRGPIVWSFPYATVVAARSTAHPLGKRVGRWYWLFRDRLYVTNHVFEPEDATALLMEAENKLKAKIAHARALREDVEVIESPGRPPIPKDVKLFVWQRDKGRCVDCGSTRNLEYDHDIPFSKGGSNTARNIRLLCEACNRSKGPSLA